MKVQHTFTSNLSSRTDYLLVAGIAVLLFFPFLGGIQLFDWDEINFAECSREMITTGNYLQVQINFKPFWEKPPLFFWLQSLSMHLFGVSEYGARFPNAVAGVLSLMFLFFAGSKWQNRQFAWVWVLTYVGSTLPHLYFKSGIIDPWFNLFTFASLFFFVEADFSGKKWPPSALLSGFLLGLAILTKGPAAPLMMVLTLSFFWIIYRRKKRLPLRLLMLVALATITPPLIWFGLETMKNGTWFVKTFIAYQYRLFSTPDAGHQGFPGYHLVVLLIGCFPASLFSIPAFQKKVQPYFHRPDLKGWMVTLFWVVVVLFSIVQSKIVHYSSLAYFPLTFLSASFLAERLNRQEKVPAKLVFGIFLVGSLYVLATLVFPILIRNPQWLDWIQDPFAWEQIRASVDWSGWESLAGLALLLGFIGFYSWNQQKKLKRALAILFGTQIIFITLALFLFSGKIQEHTQGSLVRFFASHAEEDCYFRPLFKTYVPYFYGSITPDQRLPEGAEDQWLFDGPIDKDVYFVRRIHQALWIDTIPDIQEIGRENGYVFYKRNRVEDTND